MSIAATQSYFMNNQQYTNKPTQQQQSSATTSKLMESSNCSACLARFLEFRNQVTHCMSIEYQRIFTGQGIPAVDSLHHIVYQSLRVNDHDLVGTVNGKCLYCDVHIELLKRKALEVVQSQFNPFLRNMNAIATQQHLELMDRQMASRGESSDSVNGQRFQGVNYTGGTGRDVSRYQHNQQQRQQQQQMHGQQSKTSPSSPTPAAHFFAEAAKVYNYKIPNKKKSSSSSSSSSSASNSKQKMTRRRSDDLFPTNFSHVLQHSPPPNPPGLFKYMGRRVDGKVSVMLRVQQSEDMEQSDSFIEVDQRKKHISVLPLLKSPESQQTNQQQQPIQLQPPMLPQQTTQPKLFGFDQIFEPELSQSRVSSGALLDVLHAVINGGDGAIVTYGGPGTGKTYTMVGRDDSNNTVGMLPCAISWLYSLINDFKERTKSRISVRVSAMEVVGRNEQLRDLLSEQASGNDSIDSNGASPGIYLREDPQGGSIQIDNVSELQVPNAEKAGFYLDAALAARTTEKISQGHVQGSHMICTFHIYQYRVEKNIRRGSGGSVPYSGGRSRLHLIDLSYVHQNFDDKNHTAPSHLALGQIIIAMLNGNKKINMCRDSKISRLLRDSIGNPTCRATLLAHVSTEEKHYRKTLQTLNVTSKIAKTRRKKNKNCGSSSDNNSCDEGKRYRLANPLFKNNCLEDHHAEYISSASSAGEDSCDTVIYNGGGHISDRDLTDNERPPSPDTMKIMKMKLASSSEDETTEPTTSVQKDDSVDKLRAKLSSVEENCDDPVTITSVQKEEKIQTQELSVVKVNTKSAEKAVNIVAPMIVEKEVCNVDRPLTPPVEEVKPTLPSSEINKASFIEQFLNTSHGNATTDTTLVDISQQTQQQQSQVQLPLDFDENISEKSLRKREKRIERLLSLASSFSEDESTVDIRNHKNRLKNEGYASDHGCSSERTRKNSKFDGYISAPEYSHHVRSKPVQVVKGTVRTPNIEGLGTKDKTLISNDSSNIDKFETKSHQPELARVRKESFEKVEMTVGKFSSIRDASSDADAKANENNVLEAKKQKTTENSSKEEKLQNLNHVITVSNIPNFSVAKKPSLSQISPKSPNIKSVRMPLKNDTRLNSTDSVKSPTFQRRYSREDTVSLVSSYDSDAYESDTFSSYGVSPALSGHRRPQRVRYRWSTVYEEAEDNKKCEKSKDCKQKIETVVDAEAKPSRIITSPKNSTKYQHGNGSNNNNNSSKQSLVSRFTKSPKTDKKSNSSSETPRGSKKYFSSSSSNSKSNDLSSPKSKNKFNLLSPRSERKHKKGGHSSDKRMSGCSDASSGLDSGIHSQTSSLRSGEDIKMDDGVIMENKEVQPPTKNRLWLFGSFRKSSRSLSGYMSDSHVTDASRSRKSRLFGSRRSKSSLNGEGYCSGYDTSVTEGAMTSCAEDNTDSESVSSGKKKKRFLSFRRRSTNDLSRSRQKTPSTWIESRHCQSDDEGMQLKVYHLNEQRDVNKKRAKSVDVVSQRSSKSIDGLRKHREHLKSELRLALDIFPRVDSSAQKAKFNLKALNTETPQEVRQFSDEQQYALSLEQENAAMGKKLKVLRNHIQVVTCFDGSRKVTQI